MISSRGKPRYFSNMAAVFYQQQQTAVDKIFITPRFFVCHVYKIEVKLKIDQAICEKNRILTIDRAMLWIKKPV